MTDHSHVVDEGVALAPARKPAKKDRKSHDEAPDHEGRGPASRRLTDEDAETYRLEVGYVHGVKPGNIVGAIANVAGLPGKDIGHVDIRDDHTFVGLPKGMPRKIMQELAKTRVAGRMLQLSLAAHVPPKPLHKPPKRQAARPRHER